MIICLSILNIVKNGLDFVDYKHWWVNNVDDSMNNEGKIQIVAFYNDPLNLPWGTPYRGGGLG